MTDFRIGIDADAIERAVHDSLRGLDKTLAGLHDLHDCCEKDVEIDETIEVGAGAELIITTTGGDVHIRGRSGNHIRIKADGETSLPEPPQVERDGNRVSFKALPGSEIDVEATVPRDCRIRVNTTDGDVEIEDTGAIEVKTVNGDVTAEDIAGDCAVTTGHADVTVERMIGVLTVNTINGDLEVSDSHLGGAQLHSVDGEVSIDAALGNGPFAIQTVNGDVNLKLAPGTGAAINFHTANGEISCDLPAQVTTSSKREWQATVNGGGPHVDIGTVNGDLEIDKGRVVTVSDAPRPVPPVPPVPPEPAVSAGPAVVPAAPEDTTDVLRALERGEISVDEAMERLSGSE
jgi:hypothetical protein